MNIRKNIDYIEMYIALDHAMASEMAQMELYCDIGKAVSLLPEKGAAVAAAKYLTERYPDAHGFSPRNVRRMRDFYRTYENHPAVLTLALQIGWTQNVVIIEAELTMEQQIWYMKAIRKFNWSKQKLVQKISENAYEEFILANTEEICYTVEKDGMLYRVWGLAQPPKCLRKRSFLTIIHQIFVILGGQNERTQMAHNYNCDLYSCIIFHNTLLPKYKFPINIRLSPCCFRQCFIGIHYVVDPIFSFKAHCNGIILG